MDQLPEMLELEEREKAQRLDALERAARDQSQRTHPSFFVRFRDPLIRVAIVGGFIALW